MSKRYNADKQYRPYINRFHNHPYAIPVTTFLVLFFLSIASFIGFNAQNDPPSDSHIIEFSIERERRSIPTRAKTVGEFLKKIDVTLGENDIVEPGLDTKIDDEKFHINVYRARPITIVEAGKDRKFAYSAATTPRSVVRQAGVEIYPEDRVESKLPESFLKEGVLGEKVIIERSTPANINLYGSHVPVRTHAQTVRELLEEKNINVADKDEVRPSLDTPIRSGIQIFVVRPGTKLVTAEEEIPMPVETVEDPRLSFGVSVVRQEGSPGKRVVTYQVVLENGKEVGRKKIQEVVAVKPVKQVVAKGKAAYIAGNHASIMSAAGIPESQHAAADYIISHESGWRVNAMNASGCAGLGQSCPASKLAAVCPNWQTDPVCQMGFFNDYAVGRYGSWNAAYEVWQRQRWW